MSNIQFPETDPPCSPNPHNFPPGLLGEVAHWVMASAAYPNPDIALVAAIALLSTITGRGYNTYTGAGLNQYLLLLAPSGMGKEAIASAISKLFAAILKSVPAIEGFKGPGYVASVQALIKWLDKHPATLCIFGEFGQRLKAMARNPSPNDAALLAGFLEFYSKSGNGNVVGQMAYSDKEKNTSTILSPNLNIVGETVPGEFYQSLDSNMISNGLLPRFSIVEVKGQRPYLNENPAVSPPPELVQLLTDVAGHGLSLAHNGNPHFVQCDPYAKAKFREFERWTTDQINASGEAEVHRQLWNRANLKALKLASVYAVGVNYLNPVIDFAATMWATDLIANQTHHLIGKFERNEVGAVDGDEAKQRAAVLRIINNYITRPYADFAKSGCDESMHKHGIVTHSYLSKRINTLPAFKNDRLGPTAALKRVLTRLLEDDEIREVPRKQMVELFGSKPRAFVASSAQAFLEVMSV